MAERSSHWRALEKGFLHVNGTCAACGGVEKLQVHHIVPFHINPADELKWDNLITLCMAAKECHLRIGHLGNWEKCNPNVKEDAANERKDVHELPVAV